MEKEIIFNRRSVREFKDQEVKLEDLKRIVKAGMYAPSAMNEQAWEFIILNDAVQMDKLSLTNPYAKALKTAKACVVVLTNKDLVKSSLYFEDMAAATENMMLYATKMGIASCWIGTYPKEDRMNAVKEYFKLPENYEVFSMIAFGYPLDNSVFKDAERYDESKIHINRF